MTTETVPYHLTDKNLTVFIDGEAYTVTRPSEVATAAIAVLRQSPIDTVALLNIVDPARRVRDLFSEDDVEVTSTGVTVRGRRIGGYLEKLLQRVASEGLNINPWKRFVARLSANPSETAREELDLFLSASDLPITPDGCFLAYKRVREDYRDVHSGTFDNSVGQVVTMPRETVDANRNRTCSSGLHFCSQGYLKSFFGGRGHIMVLKIDPADVVSIPSDYNNTKGRCARYTVVDEVDLSTESERQAWGIIESSYSTQEEIDAPYDWGDDDIPEWELDGDNDYEPIPERAEVTGFWRAGWNKLRGN